MQRDFCLAGFLSLPCLFGPLAGAAAAQEAQALEELFQSETVFPQDAGEMQITLAPRFLNGREARRQEAPLSIEYGISDAFQLELDWAGYVRNKPVAGALAASQGAGDLEIGARYSWMNMSGSGAHAAMSLELTIPTGDEEKDLGEGQFAVAPALTLAADLAGWRGAQVLVNLGAELNDGAGGSSRSEWFGNLAVFAPAGPFTLTSEINLSGREAFFTPGIVWRGIPGFELGLGAPVGLNQHSDRSRVILMLTHEFD